MVDNKTRVKWLNKIKEDTFALEDADDSIKQDKEIVLAAVANFGNAIQYADASLKKDKEIVLAAVKQYGHALQYADASLKKDKEVVLAAVKNMGPALASADQSFTKDKEIVLAAVKSNTEYNNALWYADDNLKKDKEVVLAAVKQNGNALQYAHDSLKKDKEIIIASLKDKELIDKFIKEQEASSKGIKDVLPQLNKFLSTVERLEEGRVAYYRVWEQERETGSIIQYDEENDEEVSIDGYTIWVNKTGGEAIWNLPDSVDDFIKVLQQIEWVQSDSEDEPNAIGADEMDFTDSTGSGSTVYDEEDNEITDYEEFQGEGATEVIHLESSNKPGHIKIIFKNQKYVLFENNGEDQYLVKLVEEPIGLLKKYEDVLVCVRLLLEK